MDTSNKELIIDPTLKTTRFQAMCIKVKHTSLDHREDAFGVTNRAMLTALVCFMRVASLCAYFLPNKKSQAPAFRLGVRHFRRMPYVTRYFDLPDINTVLRDFHYKVFIIMKIVHQ